MKKRSSSQVQIAFDLEGAKKAGNTYPENAQKIADNAIVESQKTGLHYNIPLVQMERAALPMIMTIG